jgi:uncharacterized protein (TIGR03435 family)
MDLIMSAWPDIEVQPWRVSGGPAWLKHDTWDVPARLPPSMPADQEALSRRTEAMLRNFLTEEFKLRTHREMKEYSVYALVVAWSGAKLKPSEEGPFASKSEGVIWSSATSR